jgi:AcrR family transcriptional regulator
MGRPRIHDAQTAEALLDAAEVIAQREGVQAITVRHVADAVGTTTRAVYSAFGSKDGLLVGLGRRAFAILQHDLEALPETADPAADLVEAGLRVFRPFAVEHPSLYRIGILQDVGDPAVAAAYRDAAWQALEVLDARVERLAAAGQLTEIAPRDARRAFHAMCEGLAAMELRGFMPPGEQERVWREALGAVVRGFAGAHHV